MDKRSGLPYSSETGGGVDPRTHPILVLLKKLGNHFTVLGFNDVTFLFQGIS